jgi:hypothetical protein
MKRAAHSVGGGVLKCAALAAQRSSGGRADGGLTQPLLPEVLYLHHGTATPDVQAFPVAAVVPSFAAAHPAEPQHVSASGAGHFASDALTHYRQPRQVAAAAGDGGGAHAFARWQQQQAQDRCSGRRNQRRRRRQPRALSTVWPGHPHAAPSARRIMPGSVAARVPSPESYDLRGALEGDCGADSCCSAAIDAAVVSTAFSKGGCCSHACRKT